MGMRSPQNERSSERARAIGLAIGASICAAVATMFVPTAMLEAITGATGLSELIPATAAPLGDKARALIAFAAGAVTMAVAAGFLSHKNKMSEMEPHKMASKTDVSINANDDVPLMQKIRQRIGGFGGIKMPWARSDASNDVYELTDLPELRAQDAHPDTPRRRPISAASDFGDIGLDGKHVYMPDIPLPKDGGSSTFSDQVFASSDYAAAPAEVEVLEPVTEYVATVQDAQPPIAAKPVLSESDPVQAYNAASHRDATGADQPSLSELVAQFERALESRKEQLAALEALAAHMAATARPESYSPQTEAVPVTVMPQSVSPQREQINQVQRSTVIPPAPRPPLEAVPASVSQKTDDDMDAALNAALATLQRMNAK
jgi:hypothetical protein